MENKRTYNFLIFTCVLVWVICLGSKNIYTAEYIEIGNLFGVDKPRASLAMTFNFITYSALQIILFFVMGKINIKWYMFISIFLSGIVTVFVALATNLWQLWWILAINGILQASVWGMCTAVLDKYLPIHMKAKANILMNVGMPASGIISYGSASLFVSFKRFDSPFTFFGILLSISAVLFFIAVSKCSKLKKQQSFSQNIANDTSCVKVVKNLPFTLKTNKKKTLFVVVSFLLSIVVHFIYYGVLNWIPSLLTENFNMNENLAQAISVIAPITVAIAPIFAIRHCEKYSNFVFVGFIYLVLASVCSLLLIFLFKLNVVLTLILICTFLTIIQGTISIVFSVISYKLSAYVNAGAHAGLMNAAGGISAGFAPTIIGAVIERYNGWQLSYLTIFGITLLTSLFIAILLVMLNKSRKKKVNV